MNDVLSLCRNQVMAFFRHLDDRNYDALAALLSGDSEWHRQGKVLRGRQSALAALALRPGTLRIHHLITNLVADRAEAQACDMRAYMLVLRHDDGTPINGPAPLAGIENVRTTYISLSLVDGQWLISRLSNDEPSFAVVAPTQRQEDKDQK